MLDCACLAAIVALMHFRRPEVEVVGDQVIVVGNALSLLHGYSNLGFAASSDRTGTNGSIDAPHAILPHIRILPREVYPRDYGSKSDGTTIECWGDVNRAQRPARTVCGAKGGRGAVECE